MHLLKSKKTIQMLKCLLVFLVCIIALLTALNYTENYHKYDESAYTHDEANYVAMARRLAEGGFYSYWGDEPDAYVSPGFPLFLTVCMKIFGTTVEGLHYIKILQAVLSVVTVLLTFCLGYQLTQNYIASIIASFLIAINGMYGLYASVFLTESFYYFTMMLAFVIFVMAVQTEKLWLHFCAGFAFCVSIMVRPLVFVVLPFLYLPLILRQWKNWKAMALPILMFAAGFLLVVLPWWIRNIVILDRFVLFATQTNPIFAGLAPDVEALGLHDPGSMFGNVKLLFQLLKEDFVSTVSWMTIGKFGVIFGVNEPVPLGSSALSAGAKNAAVFLGMVGALLALFNKRLRWPAVVLWVYLLSSFLFIPVGRYGLQYYPFLSIFAGALIVAAYDSMCDNNRIKARIEHKT